METLEFNCLLNLDIQVYLVHNGGGWRLDAWLLVREWQLLQKVHIGQRILQSHVGRHGCARLLKKQSSLETHRDIFY